MPLKLLKHKSWHVSSAANIERVRRDELQESRRLDDKKNDARRTQDKARLRRLRDADFEGDRSQSDTSDRTGGENGLGSHANMSVYHFDSLPAMHFLSRRDNQRMSHQVRPSNDSFVALASHSRYERLEEGATASAELSEKSRKELAAQDPLTSMKRHLARKKALKLNKKRKADGHNDQVLPDRYSAVFEGKYKQDKVIYSKRPH